MAMHPWRAGKRDENGGCDQTLRAAHGRFPSQLVFRQLLFSQLLATGGSKASSASRVTGFSR